MSRPPYEQPVITRLTPGLMNKFGGRVAAPVARSIDGVPVAALIAGHGSPLFVFSEASLRARQRELLAALSVRYPRVRLAWSYKTNTLGAICRVFHEEGSLAEVVSAAEYERALQLGVRPADIVFNGPFKPEPALEKALLSGSMVNLDHYDELAAAERIAARHDHRLEVGLRVNMTTGSTPHWDRFGFNLENGQALAALERIASGGRLSLAGLHCHIGTFVLEPDAYRVAARKLAGLAGEIRHRTGTAIRYLDLGGGFASHNTLHGQYLPGSEATPSFSQYAEAIADGLQELGGSPASRPELILETGRALADEAGSLVTTVHAVKRLADGRRALILDAGVNLLFTAFWYRHDVHPAVERSGRPEPTALFGPLCMQIDVIRESLMLPPLEPGDPLVVRNVGAYNVTQWLQFITTRPAVVLIGPDRTVERIREAETLADVTGPERLPGRLAPRKG